MRTCSGIKKRPTCSRRRRGGRVVPSESATGSEAGTLVSGGGSWTSGSYSGWFIHTGGFDSAEQRRLCLEHLSSTVNPPEVSTCAELVMCVRNMLATYEELWMLEWRESLESMMTGYFERLEANENRFLDWAFAARHVMEFFYQLQRAAQQPRVGVVFAGHPRPLVLADELPDPRQWWTPSRCHFFHTAMR